MEPQITEDTLIISPTTTYLRPEELVLYRESNALMPQQTQEADATSRTVDSEDKELDTLYSILRLSISTPRIERLGGRSLAVWDEEKCMARVIHKDGKFDSFGTTSEQQLYLEYFEALYLLESGRLQLEHHAHILSIEQAYLLLLGEAESKKYSDYFVYAYLTRVGYILTRYKNKAYQRNSPPTETDCVWAWLHNVVESRLVPGHIKKTQMYANTKRQLELIKCGIIEQRQTEEVTMDISTEAPSCSKQRKRKAENPMHVDNSKSFCACAKSFLDFMTAEPEYNKFYEIFQKFELIKIKPIRSVPDSAQYGIEYDDDGTRVEPDDALDVNFDLYLHSNGFKKSAPAPPLMRVVVLRCLESFPNHSQISHCSRRMLHPTPILIVSVGDAKQIQALLYFFT